MSVCVRVCNMNRKREIFDQRMCMQFTCACTFRAELGNEKQQQKLQQQYERAVIDNDNFIEIEQQQNKTHKITIFGGEPVVGLPDFFLAGR